MRVVMFYHSLVSDWNHGNAHFLRGVVTELMARGHDVRVLEPENSWSRDNLVRERGELALASFQARYPHLTSHRYALESLDLGQELAAADLVLVHEWNEHQLVEAVGRHRAVQGGYRLFFHDTHHRSVTDPNSMASYRLKDYDGVLAFGEVIRERYLAEGWADRAWNWHEAADIRVFHPYPEQQRDLDLVWVGNWGDEERTAELERFLIRPVESLGLRARVHGVRYPPSAQARLADAGIEFSGWIPNYEVPYAYAAARMTLHIPRRPYVQALPGIPTIRVFEALACGIPLVCSPWDDAEHLFSPGEDYLVGHTESEVRDLMGCLLAEPDAAREMAERGRATVLARHTCGHRVEELLQIMRELNQASEDEAWTESTSREAS